MKRGRPQVNVVVVFMANKLDVIKMLYVYTNVDIIKSCLVCVTFYVYSIDTVLFARTGIKDEAEPASTMGFYQNSRSKSRNL